MRDACGAYPCWGEGGDYKKEVKGTLIQLDRANGVYGLLRSTDQARGVMMALFLILCIFRWEICSEVILYLQLISFGFIIGWNEVGV